jgi:hypothetical protein
LKDKNELSKTFSQWLSIKKYHPSTIIRADTICCTSQEEFEDTKGAIRKCISKNRQHNGQKKKHKRTNNDREKIHIKLKIEKPEPH